jgi:hypothetical protein
MPEHAAANWRLTDRLCVFRSVVFRCSKTRQRDFYPTFQSVRTRGRGLRERRESAALYHPPAAAARANGCFSSGALEENFRSSLVGGCIEVDGTLGRLRRSEVTEMVAGSPSAVKAMQVCLRSLGPSAVTMLDIRGNSDGAMQSLLGHSALEILSARFVCTQY